VCLLGVLTVHVTTLTIFEIDVLLMILVGKNYEITCIYVSNKTDRKRCFEIQLQCGKLIVKR
jgi:hypothetical protein